MSKLALNRVVEDSYLQARITKLLTVVEQIDDVLLKLSLNPRQSYTINTGQTTETVTTANALAFRALANGLMSDIEAMQDQLDGGGDPTYTRPAF
jgi:hypothetical protein